MKKITIIFTILLALSGCDYDVKGLLFPVSDSVDARFEQSMAWNELHGYATLSSAGESYRIYVGTDIHAKYSANNLRKMLTAERNDSAAICTILLGDCVSGNANFPTFFAEIRFDSATQVKRDTIFATVGNHDLQFDQWPIFRDFFGTSTYYFEVKTPVCKDLFVSLDSGNGTFGSMQLGWLKKLLQNTKSDYRHITIFTHTDFFRTDFTGFPTGNFSLEETYEFADLAQEFGVDLVLQGHNHSRHEYEFGGVCYLQVETMKDDAKEPHYLVATFADSIAYDFVSLKNND